MANELVQRNPATVPIAYVLWLPCFFGIFGLHRFYTGRWISGLVWLLTGGLCGMGQVVDLLFMKRMVDDHNRGQPVW